MVLFYLVLSLALLIAADLRFGLRQRLVWMVATHDGWLLTSRLIAFTALFMMPSLLEDEGAGQAVCAGLVFIGGLWLYASLRTIPSGNIQHG